MSTFLGALYSGSVMLMDGAMGTEQKRAGLREGECAEIWNVTYPERVGSIHRSYVEAGAHCILTNTFQANPWALGSHGLAQRLQEITHAAVRLARGVAGPDRFVIADIGPFGAGAAAKDIGQMVSCFEDADALLLETCSDLVDLAILIEVRRSDPHVANLPILFSLTYLRTAEGKLMTIGGATPKECAREAQRLGIAALGVNCGKEIGMEEVIEIVKEYRGATDIPLFARPNAGTPKLVGDKWVYPRTPESMAGKLAELIEAGVSLVGGCCGTSPEYTRAFRAVIEPNEAG